MNKVFHFFSFLLFISLVGCINFQKSHEIIDSKIQRSFDKNYRIKGLFDHIPKYAKQDIHLMGSYPPLNLLPENRCKNRYGEIIVVCNKNDYPKELKKVLKDSLIYISNYYYQNNLIINISELHRTLFPVDKCNKYYLGKKPIPYFEDYDFGLGEKETLKKIYKDEKYPRSHTIYNIPKDLKVYVIEAKAGDFWKYNCEDRKIDSLKQWSNGYSKGIALSESEDIVVFWVIVW